MSTENGKKMQSAIEAVCRMHGEVSKLLVEFEKLAPWSYESVFGNYATRDLTYNVRAAYWMPEGVYRYLHSKSNPGLVEAITVCFVDPNLQEPVLLLAQLQYRTSDADMRTICNEWDLWHIYFDWNDGWEVGVPKECRLLDNQRILTAYGIFVPLYSIGSMDDVRAHLERLRTAAGKTFKSSDRVMVNT